jgi:hypothetical protein
MSTPQQVFKNRKEALTWLRNEGGSVSQGKFYQDCDEFHLTQPDKTVLLCDLIAYMRRELKTGPTGPAQDLGAEEHNREMRDLEKRKLRADVEAKERANRKEDDRWMEVVAHETQLAAFAGQIEESLQQVTTIKLSELLFIAGGELSKAAEFAHALDRLHVAALTDAVREQVKTVVFEDEEHHGESAE